MLCLHVARANHCKVVQRTAKEDEAGSKEPTKGSTKFPTKIATKLKRKGELRGLEPYRRTKAGVY